MVEVKNVSKSFQSITAVSDLSFSATGGEIFGLIGPNGAGKSTTIRMIMNILAPDSGTIFYSGTRMTEADKDRIGYLPEERGLPKKLVLMDALTYFASLKGAEGPVVRRRIEGLLERFGLAAWKKRKILELSKGMAQKAQFILAIAHDPDILVFDEPFSGLDPVSSDLMLEVILELGRAGKTILFSTHVMEQAERICSRILLIDRGREVVSGSIPEVKGKYGKRSVLLEFEGDGDFIARLPCVSRAVAYPSQVEAELADGFQADDLLRAVLGRVSVSRFELMQPSLHKIFVDLVGASGEVSGE
jgi:ABC-2 type transport system ATP-binding protein